MTIPPGGVKKLNCESSGIKKLPSWAISATLLAGLMTGCAPEPLPVLNAEPITGRPVLTQDQTFSVLDDVSGTLSAATSTRDPELLSSRLTGPRWPCALHNLRSLPLAMTTSKLR